MKKYLISLAIITTLTSSVFALNPSLTVAGNNRDIIINDLTTDCGLGNFSLMSIDDIGGNVHLDNTVVCDTVMVSAGFGTYPNGHFRVSPINGAYANMGGVAFDFWTNASNQTILSAPITENGMSAMVRNATTSFMGALGFTPAQAVGSVGDIFIKPIMGGGLMMLDTLLPWIIALVVLSAFVYFAYSAFRFYGGNARKNTSSKIKEYSKRRNELKKIKNFRKGYEQYNYTLSVGYGTPEGKEKVSIYDSRGNTLKEGLIDL